jgi:thiol-disulfide isomerase/thioredoxin
MPDRGSWYASRMYKSTGVWLGGIIGIFIVIAGGYVYYSGRPSGLDSFASCLSGKGVTFYGTFWCPHCQAQKALFGRSASKLPYTECSLPSGQGQTQVCIDAEIKNYPTWEFAGGERLVGEQSLEALSQKSGCELSLGE